jgi:hypothetical protein
MENSLKYAINWLESFKNEEQWYQEQYCSEADSDDEDDEDKMPYNISTAVLEECEYKSFRLIIDKAETLEIDLVLKSRHLEIVEKELASYKSTFEKLGGDHSVNVYECLECGKCRYNMMECCGETTHLHQPLHFIGDAMVEKSMDAEAYEELKAENAKLKADVAECKQWFDEHWGWRGSYDVRIEENEKLKEENEKLKAERDALQLCWSAGKVAYDKLQAKSEAYFQAWLYYWSGSKLGKEYPGCMSAIEDGKYQKLLDECEGESLNSCDFCDNERKVLTKRDAGYDEWTCATCHKEQYPEEYEEEDWT